MDSHRASPETHISARGTLVVIVVLRALFHRRQRLRGGGRVRVERQARFEHLDLPASRKVDNSSANTCAAN